MNCSVSYNLYKFYFTIVIVFATSLFFGQGFEMDALKNEYRWSASQISKKEISTGVVYQNNFISNGNISSLHLNQPMKPMLFFEDTQKILFIDNTLSSLGEIQLSPLQLGWVTFATPSNWGGIWLWDNSQKTLYRINNFGEILLSIPNIRNNRYSSDWEVKWMEEDGQFLYLRDNKHLFVLDMLGGIIACIPVNEFKETWLIDGQVWEHNDNAVVALYPKKGERVPIASQTIYLHSSGIFFGENYEMMQKWP